MSFEFYMLWMADQTYCARWTTALLIFKLNSLLLFSVQINWHLHVHIFLCSIHESLEHPLVTTFCVSSCCLENVNKINQNPAMHM